MYTELEERTVSIDTALEVIGTLQAWASDENTEDSKARYSELEREKYIILSSKREGNEKREELFEKVANVYCPLVKKTREDRLK